MNRLKVPFGTAKFCRLRMHCISRGATRSKLSLKTASPFWRHTERFAEQTRSSATQCLFEAGDADAQRLLRPLPQRPDHRNLVGVHSRTAAEKAALCWRD